MNITDFIYFVLIKKYFLWEYEIRMHVIIFCIKNFTFKQFRLVLCNFPIHMFALF